MKTLIIFCLFLTSAFARDYKCDIRGYEVTIDLQGDKSTHMWLRSTRDYSVITQAYAGSIDRGNRVTSFYFYGQTEPVVISFRNSDIQNQANKIKGHIDAFIEGFILKGYMDCRAIN